jgi:hypothetical protein
MILCISTYVTMDGVTAHVCNPRGCGRIDHEFKSSLGYLARHCLKNGKVEVE